MPKQTQQPQIERQSLSNRIVHALVATSMFGLFFTGLGQMPVYKRYMINEVPFMAWTADYNITLWLHYFFGVLLIGVAFYHVAYHLMRKEFDIIPRRGDMKNSLLILIAIIRGKEEPPSQKYLPEQRIAYAFIAFWTLVMIVTGILKTMKNIDGVNWSLETLFWLAQIHNLGFFMLVIGVLGHFGAFAVQANRQLLSGMFGGKVDACYTKERHSLWDEGVKKADAALKKEQTECAKQKQKESAKP